PRSQLDQVIHQGRLGGLDFLLVVFAAHPVRSVLAGSDVTVTGSPAAAGRAGSGGAGAGNAASPVAPRSGINSTGLDCADMDCADVGSAVFSSSDFWSGEAAMGFLVS